MVANKRYPNRNDLFWIGGQQLYPMHSLHSFENFACDFTLELYNSFHKNIITIFKEINISLTKLALQPYLA